MDVKIDMSENKCVYNISTEIIYFTCNIAIK